MKNTDLKLEAEVLENNTCHFRNIFISFFQSKLTKLKR